MQLSHAGARDDSYSLEGGTPNEALTLEDKGAVWAVYYSERGQRTSERIFPTESLACEYFLKLMLADGSAFSPF